MSAPQSHTASKQLDAMASLEDDDEWEYEYDDAETEDYYMTLDLSNIPDRGDTSDAPDFAGTNLTGHPILLQTRLRRLNALQKVGENILDSSKLDSSSEGAAAAAVGEMQIIGLHTENPLVMYNDRLISCQWASSIGTDMFFVKPNPHIVSQDQPLRALPSVDLLAMSSAKLIAHAARLRPREEAFTRAHDDRVVGESQMDLSEDNQSATQGTERVVEERRTAPTGFLERLNQAKARRGERSRLVVSGSHLMATREGEEDIEMGGTDD